MLREAMTTVLALVDSFSTKRFKRLVDRALGEFRIGMIEPNSSGTPNGGKSGLLKRAHLDPPSSP